MTETTAARGVDTTAGVVTGITVTGIAVTGIIETGRLLLILAFLRPRDRDWYSTNDWCDADSTHTVSHRHTDGLVCWYYELFFNPFHWVCVVIY